MRFVNEFGENGILPRGTNVFFITWIPKVSNPQGLRDFRPIYFTSRVMYKIISKLLANQLKKVFPSIINHRQSAFLECKHLLHSVVIANEAVKDAKRKKKECIIFKVDYKKTYDSICWDFFMYMLQRLGFDAKWIGWIWECLKACFVLVLVNGGPTSEFVMQKGLWEGDPLIPFLFMVVGCLMREASTIIIIEILNMYISCYNNNNTKFSKLHLIL